MADIKPIPELEHYVKKLNWYLQEHYPANKKITAEEWNALFLALMQQGNCQEATLEKIINEVLPLHGSTINELIDVRMDQIHRLEDVEANDKRQDQVILDTVNLVDDLHKEVNSYSGAISDLQNNKVDKDGDKVLSANDFTDDYKAQVESNTLNRHNHKNKNILDTITASYTTEEKTKLTGISEGANRVGKSTTNGSITIDDVPTEVYKLPEDVVQDNAYVHTDKNYTEADQTKLHNLENGAQVNKIESITVNNTPTTIDTSKNVNISVVTQSDIDTTVSAHNTNTGAHNDIREDVALAQQTADEAKSIAEARPQGKTFDTLQNAVAQIQAFDDKAINAGSIALMLEADVPDLWVYKVEATSVLYTWISNAAFIAKLRAERFVQVGYYKLAKYETDIDLTDYVKKTRKINSKPLSTDITLSHTDVGADVAGAASSAVTAHNTDSNAHSALFNSKLSKATEQEIVYGTNAQAYQTTIHYNVDPLGDGIVKRTSDGRVKTTAPTEDNDSINKKYLDEYKATITAALNGKYDTSNPDKYIKNEPNAFDYNNLSNKPNIPEGSKLYDTTGQNVDGAMTQKASTAVFTQITANTTKIYNKDYGFAAGLSATCDEGGAIGSQAATVGGGGAVGAYAKVTQGGGAVGVSTHATYGGAVGSGALAGSGFSGGNDAQVLNTGTALDPKYIDAIQLGKGTNNNAKTLQVYEHTIMTADGLLKSGGQSVAIYSDIVNTNNNLSSLQATVGRIQNNYPGEIQNSVGGIRLGQYSEAGEGGAIGSYAKAGRGFSGGAYAKVGTVSGPENTQVYIDAVQLGAGTNATAKTLQVYDDNLYNATTHKLGSALLDAIYPVGCVYISTGNTSPASLIGGSWEKLPEGYTLWTDSIGSTHSPVTTIEAGLPNITGEIGAIQPSGKHSGVFTNQGNDPTSNWGGSDRWNNNNWYTFSAQNSNAIYGKSTTVQPPAIKVCMWKRTA